jgi:hypothetical protein
MGKRLEAALDALRAAVFEAYAALAEEGARTGTEQQRRESALQFIDEILEWRPLASRQVIASQRNVAKCHVWTAPSWQGFSSRLQAGRCSHVFGLFVRFT